MGKSPPPETLQNTIAEALESASTNYGVADANEWADGYVFPQEVLVSDLRCFRDAQLDFETMVRRRLRSPKEARLNPTRINLIQSINPETKTFIGLG